MRSMKVRAFLSCSFRDSDKEVVNFFQALCKGIDITCVNVDSAYAAVPPDVARDLIYNSEAVIAVATCCEKMSSGHFAIPKAVDEEMSMAYAMKKPLLIFVEKGVDTASGFIRNFGTYQEFDRADLINPLLLAKLIFAVHNLKVREAISQHELLIEQQGQEHVYASSSRYLLELLHFGNDYTWRYSLNRKLHFTSRFLEPLKAAAWAAVEVKDNDIQDVFKWDISVKNGTKPFKLVPTIEKLTNQNCQLSLEIEPVPESGDCIEYSIIYESPYLNPIYKEDIRDKHPQLKIQGTIFNCYDGIVPIIRTKDIKVQFRFPSTYGLRRDSFQPFVGSFTNKVDYLVESECKRMTIAKEEFAGNVVIDIAIQSPLLGHLYGIAWNPAKKI